MFKSKLISSGIFFVFLFISTDAMGELKYKNKVYQDHVALNMERMKNLRASGQLTNNWILANSADIIREPNQISFQANQSMVDIPAGISKLFFTSNIDPSSPESYILTSVIDSILFSDGTVASTVGEILDDVDIDSSLLHSMFVNNVDYLARSLPGSVPGETVTMINSNLENIDYSTYYHIQFPDSLTDVDDVKNDLDALPLDTVTYVPIPVDFTDGPGEEFRPQCLFGDELTDQQYYLRDDSAGIDVFGAWHILCSRFESDDTIVIAILDSRFGTNPEFHPDYRDNVHEKTRLNFDPDLPISYHGIHVTGVAAAAAGNMRNAVYKSVPGRGGIGITGVFPTVKVILLSYRDEVNETPANILVKRMRYILDSCDVDVINFSWGLFIEHPLFEALLFEAYFVKGIALIAAIGQELLGLPTPFEALPASLPFVVAVGGSNRAGKWWLSSNYGYTDFILPAVDIMTTGPDGTPKSQKDDTLDTSHDENGYALMTGTSFSSPMLAAVYAMAGLANPNIAPATFYDMLAENAIPTDDGFDISGWGKVNASGSIAMANLNFYCDSIPGDIQSDCYVNTGDIIFLINAIFYGGPLPVPNNADVNGDCVVNVLDLRYMIDYIIRGVGPAPVPGCVNPTGTNQDENPNNPETFTLYDNYPNPFNPETNIGFNLPEEISWKLTIYNIVGQSVKEFTGENKGRVDIIWDASYFSTGVYFYKLEAGGVTAKKKMLLMK